MIWKTIKEEWEQRHENMMLHTAEGALLVVVPALAFGVEHPLWRYGLCAAGVVGIVWEIIPALFKGKAWRASVFGAVTYWLGAGLAALGILIAGR